MKIAVVGTGYVGLVTGVCLSEINHQVICIDTDKEKVKNIFLVHGDPEPQEFYRNYLIDNGFKSVSIPKKKESVIL